MEQERFFEEFYQEHFGKLVTYAFGYTRDWHIAEDVVQDTFHILLRKEKMQECLASPSQIGWLKKAVKNVARNALRAQQRRTKLLISIEENDLAIPVSDDYEKEDEEAVLKRYAEFLKPQESYIFRRLALEHATYADLKDEFGISMWACYKRVKRMEESLEKEISGNRLLHKKKPKKEKAKSRN